VQLQNTHHNSPSWNTPQRLFSSQVFETVSTPRHPPGKRQRYGLLEAHRHLRVAQVLYGLMAANTAVFVMWRTLDTRDMAKHFLCSPAAVLVQLRAYTLLTCSFSHFDFGHFVRPHYL
jgi:membrane associated rhomboid family serine protease